MRTTITVAPDVAAEMKRLGREEGLGPSEALNTLARRGMTRRESRTPYEPTTYPLGITIDVSNIGEILELLDES